LVLVALAVQTDLIQPLTLQLLLGEALAGAALFQDQAEAQAAAAQVIQIRATEALEHQGKEMLEVTDK
jgi:hypothetical protein